jgi:trehalose-6-phosphate synthase
VIEEFVMVTTSDLIQQIELTLSKYEEESKQLIVSDYRVGYFEGIEDLTSDINRLLYEYGEMMTARNSK